MSKPKFRTPEQVWDLWIDTLESGKYKQTTGALKEGDSFCCLGVLCDLAVKDGSRFRWTYFDHFTDDGFEEFDDLPPDGILKYIGLLYDVDEVAELNDIDGLSFEEIAEYLKILKPICLESLK